MRYLKIIIAIVLLASCEEYFRPDTDVTEPAYVFEGLITDQPGPYIVKITKTYGYNSEIERVTDAKVRIECSDGYTARLKYNPLGYYQTDSATFVGEVGKKYKMVAIFADGLHFESTQDELLPCPDVEEVNGTYFENKKILTKGDTYYEDIDFGICATNTTNAAGFTPYYRYECKLIIQTRQYYPGTFPEERYVFHPVTPSGTLFIADANNYADNKIIGNQLYKTMNKTMRLGVDSLVPGMSEYEVYNVGEFVRVSQFSMNENQYKFWKAIKDQQESTNYFFGQIENQPIGNIKCNTGEKALGYFCVSAVKQNFGALGLKVSTKEVRKYDADTFPDTDTTAYYKIPPDYTIYFDN